MRKRAIILSLFMIAITIVSMSHLPATAEEQNGFSYVITDGRIRIFHVSTDLSGELIVPETIDG